VQRDQVRASLAKLPDEQRLAIQGVYYQGNTFAEVADVMGVPTGTVKSRVRLGLAKLQRLLAPMR
jgi:RNA polymerase sigma-70 factor (ECF subfamily)